MDLAFARQVFIEETEELLGLMLSALLDELSGEPKAEPDIADIFRAVHTIKGSSALFGYSVLVDYCHQLEDLLQRVRDGLILPDKQFSIVLLSAYRFLQSQLLLMHQGATPEKSDEFNLHIERFLSYGQSLPLNTESLTPLTKNVFQLLFSYSRQLFIEGSDPAEHIAFLRQHGEVSDIVLNTDFEEPFDATLCYLSLALCFETQLTASEIDSMFRLLPNGSRLTITDKNLESSPVETALALNSVTSDVSTVRQEDTIFLRVEVKKLDALINLMGELVTRTAAAGLQLQKQHYEALADSFSIMEGFITEMRDSTLALRMVPVSDSFSRLPLLVQELARKLNKQVRFNIAGSETELDKGVLDKLIDPLVHLIRNAVDHGIEPPAERVKLGKNAVGTLTLSAAYEAGVVVLRLSDDGAGLNTDKIRLKAEAAGLLQPNQQVDEHSLYQFLFNAGFSTAVNVSSVSGRGVGLDVVKRNVELLRGQIVVSSERDKGTVFEIRLPLTLSIIEGFLCTSGELKLVVPHAMIEQCLEYDGQRFQHENNVVVLMDELVPVIHLQEMLGQHHTSGGRRNLLVVRFAQERAALLVDELYGEFQAVIKPLHPLFKKIDVIGGTTLLNDGSVGYVLDIPALFKFMARNEQEQLKNGVMLQEELGGSTDAYKV